MAILRYFQYWNLHQHHQNDHIYTPGGIIQMSLVAHCKGVWRRLWYYSRGKVKICSLYYTEWISSSLRSSPAAHFSFGNASSVYSIFASPASEINFPHVLYFYQDDGAKLDGSDICGTLPKIAMAKAGSF